jgi:hypothetical protein
MEVFKKIDVKTIIILILAGGLIISFMFGQKSVIDEHKVEIKKMHEENSRMILRNDSLFKYNTKIEAEMLLINKKLKENEVFIANTQLQINKLNKRKNEVSNHVNNLSAISLSNGFTDYLQSKSRSISK